MTEPSTDALDSQLKVTAGEIDQVLDRLLTEAPETGEISRPPRLVEAMRHAVLAGGKRFRPFLVIECVSLFGGDRQSALLAGAAVECLHTYSLIHDDLPAMDNDDLRRGQPTVHKAFDEATAILAGDALLTLAFDCLSRPETHPDPNVRITLVKMLARAAGMGAMAGGQMLDILAENERFDEAGVRQLQSMKTGALIAACCTMGASLGTAEPDDLERLARFGRELGLAFQIADDLLDISGDSSQVGKATGKDEAMHKATLVAILGPDAASEALKQAVATCEALLQPYGERAQTLTAAARFAANRDR